MSSAIPIGRFGAAGEAVKNLRYISFLPISNPKL